MQGAAGVQLAVGEEVGAVRLAINGERVDVGTVAIGLDADTAAAGQVQRHVAEQGRTDGILTRAGTNGVES